MPPVGRARTKDKHLPRRVYAQHGAYYFVDRENKWHLLAKTYPEALTALAVRLQAEAPVDTLEHVIAKYEAEELPKKALKTQKGRRQEFKNLRKVFGAMRVIDIKPHHIWTYWRDRGETVQSRHEIRALSTVLTFARRCGALSVENPCFGLRLPQGAPRRRYVSDGEFLLVRTLAQPMIRYAMDLALIAGMDSGTIRSLERRHLTEEGILFERRKTGTLQLIEWNDDLRATVEALKREPPQLRRFLIANRHGKPYTADGFETQWQRAMGRATNPGKKGEPPLMAERFTFHDLRAKSASDAESDQAAADRLGHGDAKLTRETYRRLPRRASALKILDKKP
jgi:hypothetical protein